MSTQVVLLGSTGSIGTQALEVIDQHHEEFEVVALSAGGHSLELLAEQCVRYRPRVVGIHDGDARRLESLIASASGVIPEILVGPDASTQIAGSFSQAVVLNGITGGVGLGPTLAALEAGSTLALANKESLVVGGPLVRRAMKRDGQIVPVDSEHSAIAQCLASGVHEKGLTAQRVTGKSELAQLVLTASGGPFRGKKRADLAEVTPQQALAHPTWNMGPVVTINSSTLVNKGLELIEAHLLFDVPASDIVPVVHPQSIVHSMVTWKDGATIAQASPPDMKLPIALGLTSKNRWISFSDKNGLLSRLIRRLSRQSIWHVRLLVNRRPIPLCTTLQMKFSLMHFYADSLPICQSWIFLRRFWPSTKALMSLRWTIFLAPKSGRRLLLVLTSCERKEKGFSWELSVF